MAQVTTPGTDSVSTSIVEPNNYPPPVTVTNMPELRKNVLSKLVIGDRGLVITDSEVGFSSKIRPIVAKIVSDLRPQLANSLNLVQAFDPLVSEVLQIVISLTVAV